MHQFVSMQMRSFLFLVAASSGSMIATPVHAQSVQPQDAVSVPQAGNDMVFPANAEVFLQMLKARDAQFDNVTLLLEESWRERVDPVSEALDEAMVLGFLRRVSPDPSEPVSGRLPSIDATEPYDLLHRNNVRLTIRGSLEAVETGPEMEEIARLRIPSGQRTVWSSVAGAEQVLTATDDPTETVLMHDPTQRAYSLLDERRMSMEMSLGFGFGTRIQRIEAYERRGERVYCSGAIEINPRATCTYEMEVDDSFIVRKAKLVCTKSTTTTFLMSNSGVTSIADMPEVAESGQFLRIDGRVVQLDDLELQEVFHGSYHREFTFLEAESLLSDTRFAELTRIDLPPGAMEYTYGRGSAPGKARPRDVLPAEPGSCRWIIALDIAIVGALLLILVHPARHRSRG